MTETPPGRPSEPRTGPAAPAPAHGDGPTGPSTPTGHTEPRGCPFGFRHYNCDCKPLEATTPEPADPLSVPCAACLAPAGEGCYSVSSDEPRPAPHRLRSLAAAQHLRRCPMCAAVGWVSADEPTGDLRDRLREALIATALRQAREKGIKLSTFATATIRANAEALADAVMPVVEAETAALRQRAEQAEAKVRWLLDKLPVLERAALGTAATDSRAAVTELVECISAALDRPEGT